MASCAALIGLAVAASAAAAPATGAVVGIHGTAEAPVPEAALRAVERAVDRSAALEVLDGRSAVRRVGKARYPAPAPLEPAAADLLRREADELLEAVAFGRDQETITRGRAAIRRERMHLTATNRSESASRALGNICLFVVRALLREPDPSVAEDQARQCLNSIPDLDASIETHPAAVRILVARVRGERLGRLSVAPTAPARQPCVLRLQGRRMGALPLEIELVPGIYRVEAECGGPGLVHEVVVGMGSLRRVTVAPRLERALSLEPPLVLTPAAGVELRTEDLAQLAAWLSIAELWTLERVGSALRVTRWRQNKAGLTKEGMSSEPLAPLATSEARLEAAVDRLLCGPGCDRLQAGTSPETRDAGLLLAGVGTSAMLASWVAWQRYRELDAELDEIVVRDPAYAGIESDRDTFGTVALVSTTSGSALFAAGAPLWLPRRRGVPWWGWSAGAAGVAAVGVGIPLWASHLRREPAPCPPENLPRCERPRSTIPLGPMLVSQGASLMAIPLTFLIRGWTGSDGEPSGNFGVRAAPGGFTVGWVQRTSGL
jgi:hypothetical protein